MTYLGFLVHWRAMDRTALDIIGIPPRHRLLRGPDVGSEYCTEATHRWPLAGSITEGISLQFCLYRDCGWWRSLKIRGSNGSRGRNLRFCFVGLILAVTTSGFNGAEGSAQFKSASDRSVFPLGFASAVTKATAGVGWRRSFWFFVK